MNEVVSLEQLQTLAAEAADEPASAKRRSSSRTSAQGREWLEGFIARHLDVHHDKPWKAGGDSHRWVLNICPFHSDHTDRSAWVGIHPSGAYDAGCQHDSCSWGWAELRERYEPRPEPIERPAPLAPEDGWDWPVETGPASVLKVNPNGHVEIERQPFTVGLAGITVERVKWLWGSRIPYGKVSIIEGDPESGKSTITLDVAARVSSGTPMPLELSGNNPPAGVILVCAEDDLSDTIVPRLYAHGADLTKIGSVILQRDENKQLMPLSFPEDMQRLEGAIREYDAKLLVIDPITAYLSATINSGVDASVRRATTPLADLAQRTGCAIVLVRHLNKASDMKAKYRGGGSIAFTGAARSVLVCDKHPELEDGTRVMARVKNNLSAYAKSVTYKIESDELYDCPVIKWLGTDGIDADTLLKGKDARLNSPERDECERFLVGELSDGPKLAKDILKDARDNGYAEATLKRAKAKLGIEVERQRDAAGKTLGWSWALPAPETEPGDHD